MGANQSTAIEEVAESTAPTPSQPTTIRLYKFDEPSNQWELEAADVRPKFFNENEDSATAKPRWILEVGSEEVAVTDQFNFEESGKRIIFQGGPGIWALRFPNSAGYQQFYREYNDKLFENTYSLQNDDANREKVFGTDSFLGLGGKETVESQNQWAEDMDIDEPTQEELNQKQKAVTKRRESIYGVRMGAGDRSYLVRDNKIDVFKNRFGGVEDTGVSFMVTPPKGGSFTPNKTLLMNRERRMNMMTPTRADKIFSTDIETGKVINEWGLKKDGIDVEMLDITNDSKEAQLDDRDTFLGIGQNRLVKWDMRDPHGVVQEMSSPVVTPIGGKDYSRGTNFRCMATSGDGYIVIGSDDGKIRLYSDKSLTRANTAVPGLGAPITAVDVTYDGKWVLATTNKYLMVVKTVFKDKKGRDTNGFKSRMGQSAPRPRLLRLKLEDGAKTQNANLVKGHFTWITEQGKQERWIVASCGNYTVLWNFRAVKLAKPDNISYGGLTTVNDYHLIPKNESVVDSVFMHDNFAPSPNRDESAMVVVTNDHVYSLADED